MLTAVGTLAPPLARCWERFALRDADHRLQKPQNVRFSMRSRAVRSSSSITRILDHKDEPRVVYAQIIANRSTSRM